ncbi:(2Fe-2S) ferredoxin domain-containing protein [Thermosipho ferrireducens]|uniref:(2Fe-2S) ferredoxin domain-containing protein n=1 Tax=Thermosipho ferrireducens TaxID=2571116 RepID=A0ABX7S6Z0_9BACT|nr:(2Fe-2S) ferredoxin domain-containing protein [Thermosipho ferrireducens]QTA38344.1 (2Fe-2S) ferredoxin domain-containing protein [Thermosipho ferrireducens]
MKKLKIEICVGSCCHMLGAQELVETTKNFPEWLKEKIVVELFPCFGVCCEDKESPIVRIEGKYYEKVTPEVLRNVIVGLLERGEEN